MGGMPGFAFYYMYNPANAISVVIGINSKSGSGSITSFRSDILNYLDGKCN